jgi:hypothetical protein
MHANMLMDSGLAIIGIRLNSVHCAARRTVHVLLYTQLIPFFLKYSVYQWLSCNSTKVKKKGKHS